MEDPGKEDPEEEEISDSEIDRTYIGSWWTAVEPPTDNTATWTRKLVSCKVETTGETLRLCDSMYLEDTKTGRKAVLTGRNYLRDVRTGGHWLAPSPWAVWATRKHARFASAGARNGWKDLCAIFQLSNGSRVKIAVPDNFYCANKINRSGRKMQRQQQQDDGNESGNPLVEKLNQFAFREEKTVSPYFSKPSVTTPLLHSASTLEHPETKIEKEKESMESLKWKVEQELKKMPTQFLCDDQELGTQKKENIRPQKIKSWMFKQDPKQSRQRAKNHLSAKENAELVAELAEVHKELIPDYIGGMRALRDGDTCPFTGKPHRLCQSISQRGRVIRSPAAIREFKIASGVNPNGRVVGFQIDHIVRTIHALLFYTLICFLYRFLFVLVAVIAHV